ncbi:MAG: polysaccharide biosynthesis tyrosine autokinase [Cyanobacteria bacterium P01_F01_bin.33]
MDKGLPIDRSSALSHSPLSPSATSAGEGGGLSVEEVAETIQILRTQRQLGDRYEVVTVIPNQSPTRRADLRQKHEESQEDSLPRETLAVVVDRRADTTYEAIVSLSLGQLISWQPVLDVQLQDAISPPPPPPPPSLPPAALLDDPSLEGGLRFGAVGAALWRQAWIAIGCTVAVAAAAVARSWSDVPTYSAAFELLTEPATAEAEVIATSPTSPLRLGGLSSAADETKVKILESPRLLKPIVETFQQRYPETNYEDFERSLRVNSLGGGTGILEVTFRHLEPEAVIHALELTADAYVRFSVNERQSGIERGQQFVETQLPELRSRSQALQERLQALRQQYTTLDPESKGEQLSQQLGTFETQLLETRVELDELRAVRNDLAANLAAQSAESTSVAVLNNNPLYQSLLGRLLDIDEQIAVESARFKLEGLGLDSLQRQRASLVSMLEREGNRVLEEVNSRIRELEARETSLNQTIASLKNETINLSGLAREYSEVQQELSIVRSTLDDFLAKRETFRVDAAQQEVPWTILTPITDPESNAASPLRSLVVGTFLGALLGVGAALSNDKLKDKLHSARTVKQLTRLSLLGIIPRHRALKRHSLESIAQLAAGENGKLAGEKQAYGLSPFHEAFRSLYANIRVLQGARPVRSIVISSALAGEGKTTVAMHLAQAAAAFGHRVLVVDADLRRSLALSRSPAAKGLTDLLDADTDVRDLIRPSRLDRRLFVLTAGEQFVDPLQLFAAPEFQSTLKRLHASFDFVVYDAPPLLGLADAQMLASETDGLLFVAELGRLKQEQFRDALEELELFRTRVLGIVANCSRKPKASAYYMNANFNQKRLLAAGGNRFQNGRALRSPSAP